jgi:ferredoxin
MKVRIDPDLCTGCEDCTQAMPSLFKLGGDWIAHVTSETVPPGKEAEVKTVAHACQFEAILIEE